MDVFIVLIIVFILFYIRNWRSVDQTPIYMKLNMPGVCTKASEQMSDDVKKNIEEIQRKHDKELEECNEKRNAEKKRADYLYLKYGDPDKNNLDYLYYGLDDHPLQGDDKLMYKMYDMGQKNKIALTNRAMWNKNNLIPYFEQELRSHADSIWYDDDSLEEMF